MTIPSATQFIKGMTASCLFSAFNRNENEMKQDKNYYGRIIPQIFQLNSLTTQVAQVLTSVRNVSPQVREVCNISHQFYIPLILVTAPLAAGCYSNIAEQMNQRGLPILPKTLSPKIRRSFTLLADQIGNLARIAMLVTAAASLYFSCSYFAIGHSAYLVYREIAERGYAPQIVQTFFHRYFIFISYAGLFLSSSPLLHKAMAIWNLVNRFFSDVSKEKCYQYNAFLKSLFRIQGTSLAEYEAPLKVEQPKSLEDIKNLLDDYDENYEIDPTHCSKVIDPNVLPRDGDFSKLLALYDEIPLQKKYKLLSPLLKSDPKFLTFLQDRFPDADLKAELDESFEKLGQQEVSDWARIQLETLVSKLQKGPIYPETVQDCGLILASLTPKERKAYRRKTLLKLAIRAGGYTPTTIKRVAHKIAGDAVLSLHLSHEIQLRQALQNQRYRLAEKKLEKMKKETLTLMENPEYSSLGEIILSLGFYPLSYSRLPLSILSLWTFCTSYRNKMEASYLEDIHEAFEKVDQNECILHFIRNAGLNAEDALSLEKIYTSNRDGAWYEERTCFKFQRWILVHLGILRKKKPPPSAPPQPL